MSLLTWETPWKAGHDRDVALVQGVPDPARRHVDDARLVVDRVGDDPGLAAREGLGLVAQRPDRHGQQGHRDPLASGQQHVELASGGDRGDLLREFDELVRRVAHGGHHDDDLMAGLLGVDDPAGYALDALGIRYG